MRTRFSVVALPAARYVHSARDVFGCLRTEVRGCYQGRLSTAPQLAFFRLSFCHEYALFVEIGIPVTLRPSAIAFAGTRPACLAVEGAPFIQEATDCRRRCFSSCWLSRRRFLRLLNHDLGCHWLILCAQPLSGSDPRSLADETPVTGGPMPAQSSSPSFAWLEIARAPD